jgi:ubiquitin C-terminal hydrolase
MSHPVLPDLDASIPLDEWYSTERGICGLINLGNTCFMNTAIQCLLHTPLFVHLFMSNQYKEDIPFIYTSSSKERVEDMKWVQRWNELVRFMWHRGTSRESSRMISPALLLQDTFELARRHDLVEFSGFGQKDSVEFLLFVIDRLHQCLSVPTKMTIRGEAVSKLDKLAVDAYKDWIKFFQKEYSPILAIFYGQYYVKVKVFDSTDNCIETTRLYEPFNSMTIDIPTEYIQENRIPSLMDCIRNTFRKETITGSNGQYKKKTTRLWKLPKVILFTLKRYGYSGGKMNQQIDMNPDIPIDLGEFVYGYGKRNSRYRLSSVIHHIGTMDRGHYYASVRHGEDNWLCIDDTSVYPTDSSAVKRNVYALLYQHIV